MVAISVTNPVSLPFEDSTPTPFTINELVRFPLTLQKGEKSDLAKMAKPLLLFTRKIAGMGHRMSLYSPSKGREIGFSRNGRTPSAFPENSRDGTPNVFITIYRSIG